MAVIEPQSRRKAGDRVQTRVLALPKGNVDKGERPEEAAIREIREETGLEAELVTKLTDIKYVYVRSWGDRQRVFKVVSFYLLRYRSGRIGQITPAMRREVREALWLPLDEAALKLGYRGEREVAVLAQEYIKENPAI